MFYIDPDDYMEMANLDYLCYEEEQEKRIKEGLWETKDGENIYIKDMTTSHIKNCISYLKRRKQIMITKLWIKRFEEELIQRLLEGDKPI